MFISGGSRGSRLAIATRAGRDGVGVALMAEQRTAARLPAIYTAEEIEAAAARPCRSSATSATPMRSRTCPWRPSKVRRHRPECEQRQRDQPHPMRDLEVKRFDLMQQINARGTFVVRARTSTSASRTTRTC